MDSVCSAVECDRQNRTSAAKVLPNLPPQGTHRPMLGGEGPVQLWTIAILGSVPLPIFPPLDFLWEKGGTQK